VIENLTAGKIPKTVCSTSAFKVQSIHIRSNNIYPLVEAKNGHFFAETFRSLRRFGRLSHSNIKTHRNSIHYSLYIFRH